MDSITNEKKDGVRARQKLLQDRGAVEPTDQALLSTRDGRLGVRN